MYLSIEDVVSGRLEDVVIERPLDGARLEHVELSKLLQWFTIPQVRLSQH